MTIPRFLVSGWAGAGNIGDELLTRQIVARLRAHGAEPVVVSRDPAATSAAHGVDAVPWGPRGITALRSVDAVCLGPGGLYQDTSSLWSLPGNLAVAIAARRRGLPVVSVGVGAEPLTRRSSAWLLRRALSGCAVVTRDEESSTVLRNAGLDPITSVDLVFGLDVPAAGRRDEILVAVGPGVGPGALRPAASRLVPVPAAEIAGAVERLAEGLGCAVVFGGFRGARDREAAAAVAEHLGVAHRLLAADVDAHVEQAAASRLVVSSRYHALVLAARAGTPALVVSPQAKLASLVAQLADAAARAGSAPSAASAPTWGELPGPAAVPRPGPPVSLDGLALVDEALVTTIERARTARD